MDEYTGEKLQAMMDDLRERIQRLQRYDAVNEIHVHCDDLAADLSVAFESAFKHLERLQESMLGEISEYRNSLLDAQQRRASSNPADRTVFAEELVELTACKEQIPRLDEQNRLYFGLGLKEKQKEVKEQEAELRKETMGGRPMRFKPNRFFDIVLDHVGSLEYMEEIPPGGKVEISDEGFGIENNCEDILQIALMPDDRLVVCTVKNGVLIYRASDISLLERLPGSAMSISVLPNERLVVGRKDGELRIYDLKKPPNDEGTRDFVVLAANKNHVRRAICSVVLLPNGNLASSELMGRIEIWDLSLTGTNRALILSMNEKFPCSLGVLSNGFLVGCTMWKGDAGVLKIWDLKSTEPVRVVITPLIFVINLLILPNDQVALGNYQGTIGVYDSIDMRLVWQFELESDSGMGSLACLPNGCLMAADKYNRFHVWNLSTGNQVQTFETGIPHEIATICISSDGKWMAIASMDHYLKTSKIEIVSHNVEY